MRRRDSDSSISSYLRAAGLCLLLVCVGAAQALTESPARVEFTAFEYFPELLSEEPPPAELSGKPGNRGGIRVPTPVVHDRRWLRARFTLDAPPHGVQALYVSG